MSLELLEYVVPGITERVASLPPERQRVLAAAAARLALRASPVDDPAVAASDVAALGALREALDLEADVRNEAYDESVEAGSPEPALQAASGRAFRSARAVATLLAALDADADTALYELHGAIDHQPELLSRLIDATAAGSADPAAGLDP